MKERKRKRDFVHVIKINLRFLLLFNKKKHILSPFSLYFDMYLNAIGGYGISNAAMSAIILQHFQVYFLFIFFSYLLLLIFQFPFSFSFFLLDFFHSHFLFILIYVLLFFSLPRPFFLSLSSPSFFSPSSFFLGNVVLFIKQVA